MSSIDSLWGIHPQYAIRHYLREVPEEILKQYWGHGITKGREENKLTAALNILANSTIRGTASRIAGEWVPAYQTGDFMVVLDREIPFPPRDPEGNRQRNEIGLKVNFGALIVNRNFYPLVDELRVMFPNRKIIKAFEIPSYFSEQK